MKAMVTEVNYDANNNIVFIEDLSNLFDSVSITNDAENVVDWFRAIYNNRIRVVYRDTDNEWWEIKWLINHSGTQVSFERWHGLVWDILKRKDYGERITSTS